MKSNSCACYGSNDIHQCYCNLNNNNMQQTSVEWLQEAISKKLNNELGPYFIDLFDNAKAMEKEQIENAYGDGLNAHRTNFCNREEYYNKTYNKI
jgi:hypothetical protein